MADHKQVFVLVTGATGALGPCVVTKLLDLGYRIRTLSIDEPSDGLFARDVEVLIGDVTNVQDVRSAMDGIDAVIHLAALLHIVNPPSALQGKYEKINVDGTAAVVESAIQCGVQRVVFFSTIAVYGYTPKQILDEGSPTHPDTFYARTKLAAEQIVLNAETADGQPLGTVLRMGAVYGSRIKGNYRRLLQSLSHGRFIPVGDGRNRRTLVYEEDAARAASLAIRHPAGAGKIFNVTDGKFHTMGEIITAICSALGRTPPCISLPVRPVRFIIGILEGLAQLVGYNFPITRDVIDKYTEDVRIDGRRIQSQLGFVAKYDLAAGWRKTIEAMNRSDEL